MNAEVIRQVIDRIAEPFHPRRVILFGSHAAGMATDQSNIDLFIVSDDTADSRSTALTIRRSLGDFPVACDIIVNTSEEYERSRVIVNQIAYLADRHGKVVYER